MIFSSCKSPADRWTEIPHHHVLQGHTKIDEGAFGEIDKAYCKGKTVVVKTVLDGKGKRIAQVLRETLLELSIGAQAPLQPPFPSDIHQPCPPIALP